MVSMQAGNFVRFHSPTCWIRTRVAPGRLVNIHSTRYAIARRYMIRLRRDDFEDPNECAKVAAASGMPVEQFRKEFEMPHRRRAAADPHGSRRVCDGMRGSQRPNVGRRAAMAGGSDSDDLEFEVRPSKFDVCPRVP